MNTASKISELLLILFDHLHFPPRQKLLLGVVSVAAYSCFGSLTNLLQKRFGQLLFDALVSQIVFATSFQFMNSRNFIIVILRLELFESCVVFLLEFTVLNIVELNFCNDGRIFNIG